MYLEEVAEKSFKASGSKKGLYPKLDKNVEVDLFAKNQQLRMEIE